MPIELTKSQKTKLKKPPKKVKANREVIEHIKLSLFLLKQLTEILPPQKIEIIKRGKRMTR